MKNFITLFASLFLAVAAVAQSYGPMPARDQHGHPIVRNEDVSFRLFPTQDNRVFLKLDTRTGHIWIIHFLDENFMKFRARVLYDIGLEKPVPENIGRFMLYPTCNMFDFLLQDQFAGTTWLIHYSLDNDGSDYRKVII